MVRFMHLLVANLGKGITTEIADEEFLGASESTPTLNKINVKYKNMQSILLPSERFNAHCTISS